MPLSKKAFTLARLEEFEIGYQITLDQQVELNCSNEPSKEVICEMVKQVEAYTRLQFKFDEC